MNLMLTSLVKLTVGLQPSPLSQGGSPQWGQRCAAGLTQSRFALMTQQRHICPTFFSDLRTWFCVAGQESKLVAVIPCTDQRLRPRHTKLYVALSVGLCLLVSVLVLFFLFPRSVILSPVAVSSSSVYFTHDGVQINITNVLNITNNNFAAVQAYNLTVQASPCKQTEGHSGMLWSRVCDVLVVFFLSRSCVLVGDQDVLTCSSVMCAESVSPVVCEDCSILSCWCC
uniref:Transmembrane protein 106B-like n=1 Tax=Neolamprologus brichardi TaxID=32507 RepID=A0A3Q4GWS1_NEOBR